MPWYFLRSHLPFWMISSNHQRWFKITHSLKKKPSLGNMCNFVPITVSADGLAPPGARTSAGTVMTKFMPHKIVKNQVNSWRVIQQTNGPRNKIIDLSIHYLFIPFSLIWAFMDLYSDIQPSISLQVYTISLIILSHIGLDDTCINEPNHYWYESIYLNEISINM